MDKCRKILIAVSPVKNPVTFKGDSYICKKCSEVNKCMPKNAESYVKVLRHLWNQANCCPKKRKFLKLLWPVEVNMSKFMYLLGKYQGKKKRNKLQQTVDHIKKQYSSLRSAWRRTDMHWNEFHRATNLNKAKLYGKYAKKKTICM